MHVSHAELVRAAHEVLRMLGGYPYGLAIEAVEGFIMTHAALGKGYALTRQAARGPAVDGAGHVPSVLQEGRTLHVDLGHAPLVLYGSLVADAFAAWADDGRQALFVSHTMGGWLAPYVAYRIARHGVSCWGTWRPAAAAGEEEAPATWFSAEAGRGGSAVVVLTAPLAGAEQMPVGLSLSAGAGAPAFRDATATPIDFEAALRRAIESGYEVDEHEHRTDFTDIAARIRVVFSERSRQQAG